MSKNVNKMLLFFAVTLSLIVSGCGSKDSQTASFASNGSQSKVFGIASLGTTATGTVFVKDSSVPSQERTAALSSNGSYTADVSGLKAPYILKASGTDQAGDITVLYSVSVNGGRTNINELSDTAVAAAAAADDQVANRDMLYSRSNNDDNHRTAEKFGEIINSLRTVLAPLFALYQIPGNAVTDNDDGENSGLSAMLHDVQFTVTRGNVIVKNRETGGIIFSGSLKDLASGTFYPENMPAGPGGSTTCAYTYADWGVCQSNSSQTRTVLTTSPSGCTGTPALTQACTYVPPASACTYNYSNWGACQANNTQTRTVLQSTPAGCTGTPVLSQTCTNVPPVSTCTSFTYAAWGACQSNGTQTRTVLTSSPAGCTGGTPVLSQTCTYIPPVNACTSFTYSAWGSCQSNGTQARTVLTSSPAGCTGGTPVLSQACTPTSMVTLANITSSCTGCHGLTVNGTMFKTGGYTVNGRSANDWLTTVNNMIGYGTALAAGTTAQDYANFLSGLPLATTCTSFTYSAWSACQTDSTQTRTVATSSPASCTGGTPVLSQSCTYVPPVTTCTSFTYTAWGTCQSNSTQTRTVATSSPSGCTGGTPVLSQSCTYVPPVTACTSFTYSSWGACQSDSTQTRTVATSSPSGCTGGTPVLSQSCTYVPPVTTCTSFTYSAWGTCQSNSTQTRTVATSSPAGCTGGTPVLSQSCTYVPPVTTCTSFTYSAWGTCQSNSTQTRTVATSSPTGCTGGTPVLSQSCTYVPPTCTSFTYSAWGACQSDSTQTRTVATSSPSGCSGGTPVLSQSCTYVPPTPVCGSCHAIPPTTGQHTFHVSSQGYSCNICHGSGYSATTVNTATHNNGVKDVVSSLNFNSTARTCAPACHGSRSW